jgi:hypothetical protein
MKKSIRIFLWLALALLAILGAGTVVFVTLFDGARVLIRGGLETKVHKAFYQTYDITKVKVYRLGEMSKTYAGDTFPILPYNTAAKIEGVAEVEGESLEIFKEMWRGMSPGYSYQALCHEPVFAVEFFEGNDRVFRTSICWHCSNFYVEVFPGMATWYGFDSSSKGAQDVLKYFEEKIPKK